MTTFDRESFVHLFDQDSRRVFEALAFNRCYFEGCGLSITSEPARRSSVRNVTAVGCEQRGCQVEAAVFDTVTVDGLKTNLLQTWAAVFRHVTLRGKMGRIMFSDAAAPVITGRLPQEAQRAFDEANATFYQSVDWALDITEAEFEDCDLRGVPGRLIRRDPATQVLVTREGAMSGRWRGVDLAGTYWPTALEFFLESQRSDIVLVAPKRARKFKRLMEGLQKLRDCGVAEPG